MGTLTSQLVVRLIDQVTGPARGVGRALLGLNRTAQGVSGTVGASLSGAMDRNNAALDQTRGALIDAAAGFYLLKNAIAGPVREAMAFESAMADVKKVVDFPTPKALKDFEQGLIDLSKRVPLSVNGLAEIAAAAGQAGIAGDDLNRFTEAAAKIGVAFDISADQAGDAMAKLMTGLGLSIDEAILLTDSMNHLSNAQASSAAEILDVVRRVGAQSKQFGFTATEVSAFASAMISAGAESDVAATSFRNMGLALTKGASATKSQRNAFKALGLDAKAVSKAMQEDAVGTTVDVLKRISKLPKEMQASISSELFGNEARALGPLLTNLGLLGTSVALVADQAKYAGSSFKEFQARAGTFQNAVQIFNNRLTAMKIVIGAALIPAITELMHSLEPIIEGVTSWAQANPELTKNLIAATAAVMGLKIALVGLRFVGLHGRGGVLSMLSIGFNTVGRAAIGATTAVRNAVGLQTALAGMSGANYTGLAKVGTALRAMAMAVPGVSAISGALGAVGAALATISAPAWGLIAVGVAAVAAAGALMWKYWDRISSVVGGFAKRIGEELAPALELAKPMLRPYIEAGKFIGEGFAYAAEKIGEFASWIGSFFSKEVLSEEQKAGFEKAGYDVADRMINAIKAKIAELVEWFKSLPGKILDAIGTIDIGSRIKANLPSWLGGGSEAATPPANDNTPAISGQRASGGPVWGGQSYLVGEKGPEIFTPGRTGTITPNGNGNAPVSIVNHFTISGADDPEAIGRAVSRHIEDEWARAMRGAHSDVGAR